MRPFQAVSDLLDHQRGHLFGWVPIAMAVGIGIYFGLPAEPLRAHWMVFAALSALVVLGLVTRFRHAPLLIALALSLAGFALAAARSHSVAEPVLNFRYYGPIEGRILSIDRSNSDKIRLLLDRVVLERTAPDRMPAFVRVSLHGQQGYFTPEPGQTIVTTGHLGGPEGPVEPGGFDFQRQAWFKGLGAVGYTRTPALLLYPAEAGKDGLLVNRVRRSLFLAMQEAMPGRTGAFAAAITTGDRSGMDRETLDNLRASNLAHLLAISGLHMGLLTAFVFNAMRYLLALWPWLVLRFSTKKISAVVALGAGAIYLALSGGNVATERAYIMVSVVLIAVILERRALTIRAVAFAAVIVLLLRPEALVQPGFQMSFAATTALIAVFAALRDQNRWRLPKWLRPTSALVISSLVAGLATAPIAASHFNQVPHYGLIANLVSVPLMGAIIIPGAVIAAVLYPFGLSWIGLAMMKPAIAWILGVADWVASLDGALSHVISPGPYVIPVMVLGALFVILWQGRARFVGVLPVIVAFLLWGQAERPDLLISQSGGLLGVMTDQGRALSKARGDGFAADSWLENDGQPVEQETAYLRDGFAGEKGDLSLEIAGQRIAHITGRGASERLPEACETADIVVTTVKTDPIPGCTLLEPRGLSRSGAVAFMVTDEGLEMTTAREIAGRRIWNTRALRQ